MNKLEHMSDQHDVHGRAFQPYNIWIVNNAIKYLHRFICITI